jgi:CTP synthase (UTP-ammonia lyase)
MLAVSTAKPLVKIAIAGDFNRAKHSHWATEAALFHAGARLKIAVEPHWVGTRDLATDAAARLTGFDGVWGAPGSPFASFDGMLRAIQWARESGTPYLGTCAGFQYALIEFTRNALGIRDANTAEEDPVTRNVVITPVECPLPGRAASAPRLGGADIAVPAAGSSFERICGVGDRPEEYFCNFETNAEFVPRWQAAGLRIAALGPRGEMRAFELPSHPFFVATLFQPQLSSSFASPHPVIEGFLRACASG